MSFQFSSDPAQAEQQMRAIIQLMVAIGYLDAEFGAGERAFIRERIRDLVRQRALDTLGDDPFLDDVVESIAGHFLEVMDEVDQRIKGFFDEAVLSSSGETTDQYVLSRLKLVCFELLKRFDESEHSGILQTVDELIAADGEASPNELAFRDELHHLVTATMELDEEELEPLEAGSVIIDRPRMLIATSANHPFFPQFEWDFTTDRAKFARQAATEMALMDQVERQLDTQRAAGAGGWPAPPASRTSPARSRSSTVTCSSTSRRRTRITSCWCWATCTAATPASRRPCCRRTSSPSTRPTSRTPGATRRSTSCCWATTSIAASSATPEPCAPPCSCSSRCPA